MENYEKLGAFYLGREYDLEKKSLSEYPLLYDSKDLTTHAVCVGMTGSGKTGLCIGLLEEAVIDGIPAVIIDPKGDLGNLMLAFSELKPEQFLPWVNADDARTKGVSVEDFAAAQAELWRKGLAAWGQDAERIRNYKNAAEFNIFTPGSTAGVPVSILKSFAAPSKEILEDNDLFQEKVNTTVTSLLSLIGIDTDPLQSKDHILLSSILNQFWLQGRDLSLEEFIRSIQEPPVERIGIFDLESFYPAGERFELAMRINNLIAAPGFSSWLEGVPLDIGQILYTPEGRPRVSIFSIAHLNDKERMFFVSLLLTQMLGWVRTQPGTSSLRAILYIDEIFGYMPPVANPPSKQPLLTLLKQARAFGLGVVLATQNPVDLDYKGLSNIGTWFIGRLQTERDKERMLDGLEGIGGESAMRFERRRLEQTISSLGKRVFLMNNVHEDDPVIFQTRWVLSYLRGPLTRDQIKQLMSSRKDEIAFDKGASVSGEAARPIEASKTEREFLSKPILGPGITEHFLTVNTQPPAESTLFYEPALISDATLFYANAKAGVATENRICCLCDIPEGAEAPDWDTARIINVKDQLDDLAFDDGASFGSIPQTINRKRSYSVWQSAFKNWLYRSQHLQLLKSPSLGIISGPDESERDFRIRLQHSAHEKRDAAIEKLRKKYATKLATLENSLLRARQAVEREKEQARHSKVNAAVSFGTTLLSTVLGRKKVSSSTLGRASTTATRTSRMMKDHGDIKRAQEKLEDIERRYHELEDLMQQEIENIRSSMDPAREEFEKVMIKPRKSDIAINMFSLAWIPHWIGQQNRKIQAWKD